MDLPLRRGREALGVPVASAGRLGRAHRRARRGERRVPSGRRGDAAGPGAVRPRGAAGAGDGSEG